MWFPGSWSVALWPEGGVCVTDPVNRPVRLAGLAGVMAVGLMLTACSGDGGDGGSPSGSPSATEISTSSGSPTGSDSESTSQSATASGSYEPATETSPAKNVPVPEMPDAAKEPTEAGVEAALEYWWEASYYLQLTGDPDPFVTVSAESCIICESFVENWEQIYGSGGWSTGAEPTVTESFYSVEGDGQAATLLFETLEGPSSMYQEDGTEVNPEDSDSSFRTSWSGSASFDADRGYWVIEEVYSEGDPVVE